MDSETSKVEVELTATEKLAQLEKEKLSRRQALARIGFQAGAAAIAALTADELLRKVGKEMQRRAGDNKVAQQVAKELNNAGVAFAVTNPPVGGWPGLRCFNCECTGCASPLPPGWKCASCYCAADPLCTKVVFDCADNDPDHEGCCDRKYDLCISQGISATLCAEYSRQCKQPNTVPPEEPES